MSSSTTDPPLPPAESPTEPGAEPAPQPAPGFDSEAGSDSESGTRRLVFVVGSGRSGTSTMSGTLQTLGVHVPQPEVLADDTNPKGFGEPQWVVDFHDELLRRSAVQVSDARPQAWFESGRLSTVDELRDRLFEWLDGQFAEGGDELVIKDPRLSWFLGLWRSAALRAGATPAYVTMLRPVTEVVGSKQKYYSDRFGEVSRTAAWVNMMLHTERATRGGQRAFVRYHDLLTDWTVPLFQLGEAIDLQAIKTASANDIRKVHNFIDPSLRRVQLTWDEIQVPARLREIAEATWQELDKLPEPDGDTPEVQARLDELRAEYADLYDEAEALAQSSVIAARRASPKPPPRVPAVVAPRRVDRIPHGLRAMVPGPVRRALRKALGRER